MTSGRRHHDGFGVGQLVKDLEADGPLPGNDEVVVIRVDEGHAGLLLQLDGAVVGVVVGALDQLDPRAEALGALHLHDRRAVRHTDDAGDAHARGGQRHALGVVARRTGDDAARAFLLGELADLVIRAAQLETAGQLQVFGFQVEPFAQALRRDEVGAAGDVPQHKGCVVDFIQC